MWFILAAMHRSAQPPRPAGSSAVDEYLRARSHRRRGAVAGLGFVLLGGVLVDAAAQASAGAVRAVLVSLSVVSLLLAWRGLRPGRDPERWLRGAAGETATARLLDRLPASRWAVLHDRRIPGSRANLDHLVIGPSGVWLLDTKVTRARIQAGWRTVRFGDRRLDTGPAKWEAQVVADRLDIPVRPLVVVHGYGLRRRGCRCAGVRVVPAGGLLRRLRRRPRRLGRRRRRLDAARIVALAERAELFFPVAGRHPGEKGAVLRG